MSHRRIETWRDLHPAERRHERLRRDLAYGGHLLLGTVSVLALLGQVVDPQSLAFDAIEILLGPWTLVAMLPVALLTAFLSMRRGVGPPGDDGQPRGLAILGALLVLVPGFIGVGNQIDFVAQWLALPLLLAYTALASSLPLLWFLVQRSRIPAD